MDENLIQLLLVAPFIGMLFAIGIGVMIVFIGGAIAVVRDFFKD